MVGAPEALFLRETQAQVHVAVGARPVYFGPLNKPITPGEPLDLSTLEPGRIIFQEPLTVTSSEAAAYRAAVDDNGDLYDQEHVVPSMAVAALVMGAAIRAVDLPAGAVHTGQELEFALPVPEQAELNCTATVSQNSVRGSTRFLVIGIQGALGGKTAVAGRTTIAIAEEGA